MTTIAVSRNTIAGDRQATHNAGLKFKVKTKLYTFENSIFYKGPFHIGMAGDLETFPDVLDFFIDPSTYKKPPRLRGGEGLILTHDGKIWTFSNPTVWINIDQPFYAVGSGMLFAMGAMEQGATPIEAVKAAMKHDPSTGYGVTSISLSK